MEENLMAFFKSLEEDYGISLDRIKSYYLKLQDLDIVRDNDEILMLECLERIVQDMSTNELIKSKENGAYQTQKDYNYIFSDALYNVYGEKSEPYLDEKYKEENQNRHK